MNVTLSTSAAWSYLPLRQVPAHVLVVPLVAEEDPMGPIRLVLCAASNRAVLEPYLEQLRLWIQDPLTYPQPVIPVTTDDTGVTWFSPEGARQDFPDLDP